MRLLPTLFAALLIALPPALQAHDGYDHEAQAAASPIPAVVDGARLSLATPRVELVAVREADGGLSVYADDYASNVPLAGARLQLVVAGRSLQAAELAPGSWQLPAALLGDEAQPQARFELRGDGWTEILSAALPARPEAVVAGERRSGGDGGGLVLILLLIAVLMVNAALQRRRTPRQD